MYRYILECTGYIEDCQYVLAKLYISNVGELKSLYFFGRDDLIGVAGCEILHEQTTANGEIFFIECIEALAAFLSDKDQIGILKNFQMMADSGLLDAPAKFIYHVVDAQPYAA